MYEPVWNKVAVVNCSLKGHLSIWRFGNFSAWCSEAEHLAYPAHCNCIVYLSERVG